MKLKNIETAIKKNDTSSLPTFAVVFSYEINRINKEKRITYAAVFAPANKAVVELTRKQAKELIRIGGLVQTCKNEDGEVYDSPEKDFRRKFKGYAVQMD